MSVYLNEQEQVEVLKNWWKKYGYFLVGLVLVMMLAMTGWRYWQSRQASIAMQASAHYQSLLQAMANQDTVNAQAQAQAILDHYPGTIYASFAALILAAQEVQQPNLDRAVEHLNWVLRHSDVVELQAIARIRLARVLLAQGNASQALGVLAQGNIPVAFLAGKEWVKAQAYLMLKQPKQAKAALQLALNNLASDDPLRAIIDMQANSLAGFNNK